jgi:predicted nucleic acid-binding protein
MDTPLLVDTDILVDFLRGYSKAVELINRNYERILLSSIVVAELYAGVKGATELQVLDGLVSLFPVVPVNAQVARAGGLYRRDYGKSHGLGLADALLAATAEAENAEFMTLNVKHYPMIAGLKPAYHK